MNTIKLYLIASFVFMSFSLLAQDKMANNIDNSNIALQGYSPVSYLDLGLAQKGNKSLVPIIKKSFTTSPRLNKKRPLIKILQHIYLNTVVFVLSGPMPELNSG